MGLYNFDEKISRKNTNSLNVEGWRTYIFGAEGENKEFAFADDEFIRMWIADMEFAVAPEIREAIVDRVNQKIFGYTLVYEKEYFDVFRKWCKDRYDWDINPEEICFSAGIIPALYQLAEDLVAEDEKVMTMTPAYGYFKHASDYSGREMIKCPMKFENGYFSLDFDEFEQKISDTKLKMLFLCNPHNPSGHIWTKEELEFMASKIEEKGIWVVSDEIHCDLLRTGKTHTTMAKIMPGYDKLIVCMSASKTFNMAGLMFSNVFIRNEEERTRFKSRDKLLGSVSPLSIAAHKAAYEKGGAWLNELKLYIDKTLAELKAFFDKNLPKAVFEIPEATYFAWLDFRAYFDDTESLTDFFADKAGVLVEGGNSLFVGNADGFIRLNLAMPRETVMEALCRIKRAIDGRHTEGL